MSSQNISVSKVIGLQFGVMSPDEILRSSACRVTSKETFQGNKPVIDGLSDPRMGVTEPDLICASDGHDYFVNPGYHGHIELERPVYYIQYLGTIQKVLSCICFNCGKLLISKTKYISLLELEPEQRWKMVSSHGGKTKTCGDDTMDGCSKHQPVRYRKEGLATLYAEWKNVKLKLTPEMVLTMLRRVSDEDVHFMGFNPTWSRPEWFICQVLLVPPPQARPSVKHDAMQRSEDDLTNILSHIIKANKLLSDKIKEDAPLKIIETHLSVLQYFVACLVNNKIPGISSLNQRSGRPLKSIEDRLNGKNGRMKGNLMAKRVDFSARSVITADPNISIVELGVPLKIAKNITKPVVVNRLNIDFLTQLVRNGPDEYPGAKTVEKYYKEVIPLRYVDRETVRLEIGDIVHRHMLDGDAVLFNRQPTLHRMSMMCHISRILHKGDTFRMNVADTKCYNADFDGDEMNMHMPQSIEAEVELKYLASIPNQIISPGNNKSIIGIFQDSMLGSYTFTRENVRLSPKEAMVISAKISRLNPRFIADAVKNNKSISSFDIMSQIIPSISINYKTKLFKEGKEEESSSNHILEIRNGHYVRGQIDKGVFGDSGKGLIQRICNDFNNDRAVDFIDDLQNVVTEYLKTSAFSVGISDLIANKATNDKITQVIHQQSAEIGNLMNTVYSGSFKNETNKTNAEVFEQNANEICSKILTESGKIALSNINSNNRFVMMVKAGSKGSEINITQMMSCLGQQNVDGKRIPYGYDHRTLPHYTKYDDGVEARGCVLSSFIGGLNPQEFMFHAMGGRVGLIDTAVKSVTWETPIVLIENGVPIYTEIGRWIDNHLENEKENVKHYTDRQMELLDIDNNVYIPTTDADGFVTWGEITALTRHDPGNELFEIKTSGGRSVIVTESKSLLVWNAETKQFIEKYTPEIKVGDFVPVNAELCTPPVICRNIDMSQSKFELNEQNGIFIGLFLAEGIIDKSQVIIKNNNKNIQNFVKQWFNNHNIKYKLNTTISGYSVELSKFLVNFVGSTDNYIPTEAFIATDEFIVGLLNGYYSVNGTISKNSVDVSSSSKRLIEGISMLCSRLGIFGKLSKTDFEKHNFSIFDNWGKIFVDKINLLEENKQEQIKGIKWSQMNFKTHNNVALDEIIEINTVDVSNHPKVYDLTIPSTLNFGLANGLQVRDTSSTGYIQRRLIKGLEDLSVGYDMTVRMSNGKIVQYKYGDDAVDTTKIENQYLGIVNMSYQEIYAHMVEPSGQNQARAIEIADWLILKKQEIIDNVFNHKNESTIYCPVAFGHIIQNVTGRYAIGHSSNNETWNRIDAVFNELSKYSYVKPNELFKAMYYFSLSPIQLVKKRKMSKEAIEAVLTEVKYQYFRSIVAPGEMVGMIAGQTIGENATQLTLNTFHHAGISSKSNVTRGVPRMEEILQLSKEPKNPSLTVYVDRSKEMDKIETMKISHKLNYTLLKDVVINCSIVFNGSNMDNEIIKDQLDFDKLFDECAGITTKSSPVVKWVIRLTFDKNELSRRDLSMDDVHFAILRTHGSDEVSCVFSDYNNPVLVARISVLNIKEKADANKFKPNSLDQTDYLSALRQFQTQLLNNLVIRGITNIGGVQVRAINDNVIINELGETVKHPIHVIDTIGTNLKSVMKIEGVDFTRTISNSIVEMFETLGIEAARQIIYNEIEDVVSFDGTYINHHHYGILCDRMTYTGDLISIFRHGLNNDLNTSVICKASFEETTDIFIRAAKHGSIDNIRGVSASVMLGQMGMFGTGAFGVILDQHKLNKQLVELNLLELPTNKTVPIDLKDKCSIENLTIDNSLYTINISNTGEVPSDYIPEGMF